MDCANWFLIAAALGLGVAACDVFDESLIPRMADAGGNATSDALPDQGAPSSTTVIDVSDDCNTAPGVTPTNDLRALRPVNDTCGGNPPANVSCLGEPLAGKNFYFSFQSQADSADTEPQKWHVHAGNTGGKVALYVLNSCAATTSCSDPQNAGIRTNNDEHLSFQALSNQKYIVVVNTMADDPCNSAQRPNVLLQHDLCGDGVQEHGEACDPPSATCVACRSVLLPNSQGREPNDSPLDANIIPLADDTFSVLGSTVGQSQAAGSAGTITGIDPFDFFRLQAPTQDGSATMVNVVLSWREAAVEGGLTCTTANLAAIFLTDKWFAASNVGHNDMQAVALPSVVSGQCNLSLDIPFEPDPQSAMLSRYFIRVAAQPGNQVTYDLTVRFDPRDQ
jgi:hypothetical protein